MAFLQELYNILLHILGSLPVAYNITPYASAVFSLSGDYFALSTPGTITILDITNTAVLTDITTVYVLNNQVCPAFENLIREN